MKPLFILWLVTFVFHSNAQAQFKTFAEEATPTPTPVPSPKPLPARPKRRKEARAESVKNDRSPASSTNEMKIIPSPLQLPSALATPAPTPTASPVQAPEKPEATSSSLLPGTLKFSGFADFRYSALTAPNDPLVPNTHAESGFGIEDGAFAVAYDQGPLSFTADLSIRRLKDFDQNSGAPVPNQSTTNRLNLGADGSQLYVKYKASETLAFDLGQFDGIYGIESAESRSRSFSKPSLVSGLFPVVFTGFMTEVTSGPWSAKAFAANPSNHGTYASSAAGDDNTQYGIAVGFANETVQTQVGFMGQPINEANGQARGDRTLIDAMAGFSFGKLGLNFEATRLDDPSKNALTPGDASDHENAGFGYLGLINYKLTDLDLAGLKIDVLKDDPLGVTYSNGTLGIDSAISYGFVFHHRLHPNVDLSAEINFYDYKSTDGSTWSDSLFNVGAIVSF